MSRKFAYWALVLFLGVVLGQVGTIQGDVGFQPGGGGHLEPALGQRFEPEEDDPLRESRDQAKLKFDAAKPNVTELARQKVEVAKAGLDASSKLFKMGVGPFGTILRVFDWSKLLLEAEMELYKNQSDKRTAALERHWLVAKEAEIFGEANFKAGHVSTESYLMMKYHRLEAEIKLAKARQGK